MKHSNAVLPTCMVSVVERINWPSERLKIRTRRTFKTMSNLRNKCFSFFELKLNRCALSERKRTLKMCLEFCLHLLLWLKSAPQFVTFFLFAWIEFWTCFVSFFCVVASLFIDTGFYTSAFLFTAQTSQILCAWAFEFQFNGLTQILVFS